MNINNLKECPECDTNVGIASKAHCANESCSWNVCRCGVTYDRLNGRSFQTRP